MSLTSAKISRLNQVLSDLDGLEHLQIMQLTILREARKQLREARTELEDEMADAPATRRKKVSR